MEKLILLLADYANVDSSGKLNVLGAFGRIYANVFPARHSQMSLVIKLGAGWGEAGQSKELKIMFVDEDRHPVMTLPLIPFIVPSLEKDVFPEVNFVIQLRDFILPRAGDYQFILLVDQVEIAVLPLTLELLPAK